MELPPGVDMEAGSGLVCKFKKKMALWTGAATDRSLSLIDSLELFDSKDTDKL